MSTVSKKGDVVLTTAQFNSITPEQGKTYYITDDNTYAHSYAKDGFDKLKALVIKNKNK